MFSMRYTMIHELYYRQSCVAQHLSKRFSKVATLGAFTTSVGKLFHRLTTRTVKENFRVSKCDWSLKSFFVMASGTCVDILLECRNPITVIIPMNHFICLNHVSAGPSVDKSRQFQSCQSLLVWKITRDSAGSLSPVSELPPMHLSV